jgi:hypothetical protein
MMKKNTTTNPKDNPKDTIACLEKELVGLRLSYDALHKDFLRSLAAHDEIRAALKAENHANENMRDRMETYEAWRQREAQSIATLTRLLGQSVDAHTVTLNALDVNKTSAGR